VKGFREALIEGAKELGIPLKERHLDAFSIYKAELRKWNRKVNLTAIEDEEEIAVKHFLDSLTLTPFIEEGMKVLDIGSGAGFPGLVLKIYEPSLQLLLIEASQKKAFFLRHMVRVMGLQGVGVLQGRAEEVAEEYRGRFDLVVSRALGPLRDFVIMALPYAKPSGLIIAMKGRRGEEETGDGMGVRPEGVKRLSLPFGMGERTLLLFKKGAL